MQHKNPTPTVGMGATYSIGSDRYACTVIEVLRNGREIVIQKDHARPTADTAAGPTPEQKHLYTPNKNGTQKVATLRQDGSFRIKGNKYAGIVTLGVRDQFRDPEF